MLSDIESAGYSSLKPLRMAVRYQRHSMRGKAIVAQLQMGQPPSEKLLSVLRGSSFATGAASGGGMGEKMDTRNSCVDELVALLLNALQGLRECKKFDQHERKHVYRISKLLYDVALLRNSGYDVHEVAISALDTYMASQTASKSLFKFTVAGALSFIRKLFDKRRPQIAAIWCVETA